MKIEELKAIARTVCRLGSHDGLNIEFGQAVSGKPLTHEAPAGPSLTIPLAPNV